MELKFKKGDRVARTYFGVGPNVPAGTLGEVLLVTDEGSVAKVAVLFDTGVAATYTNMGLESLTLVPEERAPDQRFLVGGDIVGERNALRAENNGLKADVVYLQRENKRLSGRGI